MTPPSKPESGKERVIHKTNKYGLLIHQWFGRTGRAIGSIKWADVTCDLCISFKKQGYSGQPVKRK